MTPWAIGVVLGVVPHVLRHVSFLGATAERPRIHWMRGRSSALVDYSAASGESAETRVAV